MANAASGFLLPDTGLSHHMYLFKSVKGCYFGHLKKRRRDRLSHFATNHLAISTNSKTGTLRPPPAAASTTYSGAETPQIGQSLYLYS